MSEKYHNWYLTRVTMKFLIGEKGFVNLLLFGYVLSLIWKLLSSIINGSELGSKKNDMGYDDVSQLSLSPLFLYCTPQVCQHR